MDDFVLLLAGGILTFLGWVFALSAVFLLADRYVRVSLGPMFWGLTLAGYGLTWFRGRGQARIYRALVRAGANPRRCGPGWLLVEQPRRVPTAPRPGVGRSPQIDKAPSPRRLPPSGTPAAART